MKIAFFDVHRFEKIVFEEVFAGSSHSLDYFETRLNSSSAQLAKGYDVVCSFVNDTLNAQTLTLLSENGVRLIVLRSAGYNHVDIKKAKELSLPILRVPEYSPYAVAEHAVALLLTLNRKIHKAYARVRDFNFSLEGLVGFDLHAKTVGLIGLGRIGLAAARIFKGFGCRVYVYDKFQRKELETEVGFEYVSLDKLLSDSDIVSLHVPLTPETKHILNAEAFQKMKVGVYILNTGRGALIDTQALIDSLKDKKLGGAGLDVYELEEGIFFNDLSDSGTDDDTLARLLSFPNVIVTSHQAFLTKEALRNIADETLKNVCSYESGKLINQVNA